MARLVDCKLAVGYQKTYANQGQVIMRGKSKRIRCSRLIFTLYINVTAEKAFYNPYTRSCGGLVVRCACRYSNKSNDLVETIKVW